MKTFNELKKNLKKDFSQFKSVRVAVLGDTSTQFLVQALRGAAFDCQFNLQIWEADFDQIENQVQDSNSDLYQFKPEVVILFQATHKLLGTFNKLPPQNYKLLAQTQMASISAMHKTLNASLQAKIIYYNYSEINDAVFGNYATKTESSFIFQLRKLNAELMQFAVQTPNFYLCDLCTIQNLVGRANFFQSSVYINSEMVLSLSVLPQIATATLDIISALYGKSKKCLILDLDNTVWGGIIGDDGIEHIQIGYLGIGKAFTEFQQWVKKLKNRGIIICVCSKNTEAIAKEPFLKHPDMVLRLEDISVFVANWNNKVDNISSIQQILNIGFDSMVFLDDNPFERNMVRESIPEITVPELPQDPAEYLEFLYGCNLFETISFSKEDEERTTNYKVEAERNILKQSFEKEEEFLESLQMVSLVESFTKFNTPRVVQLSQRSNQFNLRTIRYTEQDIDLMMKLEAYSSFAFSLEDKFGSHGLIAVVIVKAENESTVFIESWFMSCRVLKRTMENFILNTIVAAAKQKGFTCLKGEYILTAKNEIVKEHYASLGFHQEESFWSLPISEFIPKETFVNNKMAVVYS